MGGAPSQNSAGLSAEAVATFAAWDVRSAAHAYERACEALRVQPAFSLAAARSALAELEKSEVAASSLFGPLDEEQPSASKDQFVFEEGIAGGRAGDADQRAAMLCSRARVCVRARRPETYEDCHGHVGKASPSPCVCQSAHGGAHGGGGGAV